MTNDKDHSLHKDKEDKLVESFIEELLSEELGDNDDSFSSSEKSAASINAAKDKLVHDRSVNEKVDYKESPADARLEKVEKLLAQIPLSTKPITANSPKKESVEVKLAPEVNVETSLKTSCDEEQKVETKLVSKDSLKSPRVTPSSTLINPSTDSKHPSHEDKEVKSPDKKSLSNDKHADALMSLDVSRDVVRARETFGNEFQTLLFDVGPLSLAVPLVKLGGIHTYTSEDITKLFASPEWFIGLLPAEQGNIMLVDTARLIFPEKYEKIKEQTDYQYAILLDDTRWALTCTRVREAKTVKLDEVRWAQQGSKREWFAGMVVEHMCALLEVDALINRFCHYGKQRKSR